VGGRAMVSKADPVVVRSAGEVVDVVTRMNAEGSWSRYRGHGAAAWDVLPSIWRGTLRRRSGT
jgi:hypothetical protein